MIYLRYFLLGIFILSFTSTIYAQQDEGAVKAAFIYNFINFVKWPDKTGRTNICLVGDYEDVAGYLRAVAKKASVNLISVNKDSSFSDCHILYIGNMSVAETNYLIGKTVSEPILTVSSSKDFAQRKGVVGFITKSGQIQLEINVNSAKNSGLVIDSELLELAKIYK